MEFPVTNLYELDSRVFQVKKKKKQIFRCKSIEFVNQLLALRLCRTTGASRTSARRALASAWWLQPSWRLKASLSRMSTARSS